MKNIILGIGNPILSDDGIGQLIANKLKRDHEDVDILITADSGFYLIDHIVNYEKAIFIDSIKTGKNEVGKVNIFCVNDFKTTIPYDLHSTNISSAINYSRKCGVKIPKKIYFIGIEIEDNYTFQESLTDAIQSRIENIYNEVNFIVENLLKIN